MIKSRTAQLVYLAAACTIGIIGSLASVGLFEGQFRWDFYIYFTNISNYFCVAILFVELVHTIKRKTDGYVSSLPTLKFMGVLSILLTALVYNFMLAPDNPAKVNLSIRSLSLHGLIPVLYVADWVLFYERKKTTWKDPIYSLIFPLFYVAYVIIHAAFLGFDSSILNFTGKPLIYPYFFLNFETLQVGGVCTWLAILLASLLAVGYGLYGLDHIKRKQKKTD